MSAVAGIVSNGARATSYLLGGLVVGAVALSVGWSLEIEAVAGWAFDVLGASFVGLLGLLVLATLYSLVRLCQAGDDAGARDYWLAVGIQTANGVATLALTYTLFGISIGIGSLAGQGLTPETVEAVIRDLTASFSLAFMTTVIGLPASAVLRGALVIAHGRSQLDARPVSAPVSEGVQS